MEPVGRPLRPRKNWHLLARSDHDDDDEDENDDNGDNDEEEIASAHIVCICPSSKPIKC